MHRHVNQVQARVLLLQRAVLFQGQLVIHLELFLKCAKLLTRYPAQAAWRSARCKLAPLPEPAQVAFYYPVANLEHVSYLVNAEVAFLNGFDDPFA